MLDFITHTMNSLGYAGVVFLMFLENVFPPIPSELIMPLAGFTATQGRMTLWGVALAGMAGSVLGALPLYYLGRRLGADRLKAWADQHGTWLALSGKDIDRADAWFDRQGGKAVLIGRVVPGVRSLISIPAGISGMPLGQFLLLTALGTLGWSFALAYAGSLLGSHYEVVERYLGPVSSVVVGGLALWFGVSVVKRRRERQAEQS